MSEEQAPPSIRGSRAQGEQRIEIARDELELKAATAAHKRQVERLRVEQEINEAREEGVARRRREMVGFYVVVGVALAGLIVGSWVGVAAPDPETRRWAQSLVTLVLGGIVGGLAGYFSGRVGR